MLYLRRTGFPKGALSPFPHSPPEIAGPQSNQRGIETRSWPRPCVSLSIWPQSNQRGIETRLPARAPGLFLERLNRTSVGLKPQDFLQADFHLFEPQSNQRGIETSPLGLIEVMQEPGLNRTSVGLKPASACRDALASMAAPQSNQRGIETGGRRLVQRGGCPQPQSNQRGIETAF